MYYMICIGFQTIKMLTCDYVLHYCMSNFVKNKHYVMVCGVFHKAMLKLV